MIVRYLPAILPGTVTDRWGGRPIHWLDPRCRGTGAYYPHALISVAHWRDASRTTLPDDGLRFGDSGGFQVMNLGLDLDPVAVLRWQIRRAELGPILDHPPLEGAAVTPRDPARRFEFALRQTVLNLRTALPLYIRARQAGLSFRLLGVVHGSSRAELERWHRSIARIYAFDREGEGWAVRPQPQGSPEAIARVLSFCRDHKIRRLHVFVPGGPPAVATLLLLGEKAGVERLSFDNSSPITSGNYRTILIPDGDGVGWTAHAEKFRDTDGRDRKVRDWMLARCSCSSCIWLREEVQEGLGPLDEERLKRRIAFHNVLVSLDVYETLEAEAKRDPMGLLRRKLGRRLRPVLETFHGAGRAV